MQRVTLKYLMPDAASVLRLLFKEVTIQEPTFRDVLILFRRDTISMQKKDEKMPIKNARPVGLLPPDAKVRMFLVYLKYWTLNLIPLMVYPKVLFHPMFNIKGSSSTHPQNLAIGSGSVSSLFWALRVKAILLCVTVLFGDMEHAQSPRNEGSAALSVAVDLLLPRGATGLIRA